MTFKDLIIGILFLHSFSLVIYYDSIYFENTNNNSLSMGKGHKNTNSPKKDIYSVVNFPNMNFSNPIFEKIECDGAKNIYSVRVSICRFNPNYISNFYLINLQEDYDPVIISN